MNDRFEKANNGAYNNLIVVALAILGFYLLVRGWSKSKQQTYLDNVGSDKNSQIALALRDAMNRSGISWMMSVDGTDDTLIMQQAALISDYAAVADAYRVLYKSELTTDLTAELTREQLLQFWAIVNGVKSTGTTTTGGTTSTGTVSTSLIGKTVTATQTTNIRVDAAPYDVELNWLAQNKQAVKGDVLGTYVSEMVLPNVPYSGNRNVFVRYKENALGGLYSVNHWVLKSAVSIK